MKTFSYFTPAGKYRGTWRRLEVADVPGTTLHEDGLTLVREDGSLLKQLNPYTTHPRYVNLGLTEMPGEFSGEWQLVNGAVVPIPEEDKPQPPPSTMDLVTALEQRIASLETQIAALRTAEVPHGQPIP